MSKYRVVGYEEAVALGISADILSSDYCWAIVDDQSQFIGCDGGQPEDQCLARDWKWVCEALNNEHASQSARIAELEAEADRMAATIQQVAGCHHSWPQRVRELEAERERLIGERDVAGSLLRSLVARIDRDGGQRQRAETLSESCARACEAVAVSNSERDAVRRALGWLLREPCGFGPLLRARLLVSVGNDAPDALVEAALLAAAREGGAK